MSLNPLVQNSYGASSAAAAVAKPWITDPRQLPMIVMPEGQLYMKTGQGSSLTCTAANSVTFFNTLALRGAQASVSVADTYVTVAALSGRGRLYYVIPPTNTTGAPYRPTAKITLDGVVYIIAPSADISAANRLVIGPTTPGFPGIIAGGTYSTSDFSIPNSYNDPGYVSAMSGGIFSPALEKASIVAPEWVESYGMPFVQFESSCTVEFKTSLLASATGDRAGGAVYRMLP